MAAIGCATYPRTALSAPVPIWAVFTSENSDLPNDHVSALALDSDGSLWLGTSGSGLARLDKDRRWRTYSQRTTKGGLPSDYVSALTLAPDGSLWVGTGGGLGRLDKSDQWQTYTTGSTNGGLSDNSILALAVSPDGSLWVASRDGGLAQLDKSGYWHTIRQGGHKSFDAFSALVARPDGSLWAGSNSFGLQRLDKDGQDQTYSRISVDRLRDDYVSALMLAPDGSVWAGTDGGSLGLLDNSGHWRAYSKASTNGGLPDNRISALVLGAEGSLWVGTDGGLAWFDGNGYWHAYTKATTNGRLPDDGITALASGPDGTVWVGTDSGLVRLDKNGQWDAYTNASTNGELPAGSVPALKLDLDGSLWVGTSGAGLARLDKGDHWETYTSSSTKGGLPDDRVSHLVLGRDGSLWVGTLIDLVRLGRDGKWQDYTTYANPNLDVIEAMALGPDGSLWIGTGGGLTRLDKDGHWLIYTNANTKGSLPNDSVYALAPDDADGSLWIGTSGGLTRFDKEGHWQTYIKPNGGGSVSALAVGPDGAVWIGTSGGLARLDKEGHWQTYIEPNSDGGVFPLAVTPDGSVWMATGGGLARFDKETHWHAYTKTNTNAGVPGDLVTSLALAPDGSVWIGTSGGVGHFKHPLSRPPRIVEIIGKMGKVTQVDQTVAVLAVDESYLTPPEMFRYVWRMTELGLLGDRPGPEIKTKSPVYRGTFDHDGKYQLRVIAVDRYGDRSDPKDIDFNVVLPKPKTFWDALVALWPIVVAAITGLYALGFIALLFLARSRSWAFRTLSDAAWASWLTWPFFFLRHVPAVQRWVLEPWFQAFRRSAPADIPFLDPPVSSSGSTNEGTALLHRLRDSPRLWLHGRSGMGKSSVFAAWERAYFLAEGANSLNAAVRRYGFILITVPVRHYAVLPVPDPNRPESWLLEAVRRQLDQFGFTTRDVGLVEAMLKAGQIALGLDGTNEADRDLALATFATQFPQVRLIVTSQAVPTSLIGDKQWEVWQLPADIGELRDRLLALWLGDVKGAMLASRIVADDLSGIIVSGYDLRLLADLAAAAPEDAPLPSDRVNLYRAMLERARGPEGETLRPERLEELAWTMVMQQRRRIVQDDEKMLDSGTLRELAREGLRIVRPIAAGYEFRHDQMRAFLAALWLVDQKPTLLARQETAIKDGAFGINARDQETLWGFVALLTLTAHLEALWNFAADDSVRRAILQDVLQLEASKRGVRLSRAVQRRELQSVGVA